MVKYSWIVIWIEHYPHQLDLIKLFHIHASAREKLLDCYRLFIKFITLNHPTFKGGKSLKNSSVKGLSLFRDCERFQWPIFHPEVERRPNIMRK